MSLNESIEFLFKDKNDKQLIDDYFTLVSTFHNVYFNFFDDKQNYEKQTLEYYDITLYFSKKSDALLCFKNIQSVKFQEKLTLQFKGHTISCTNNFLPISITTIKQILSMIQSLDAISIGISLTNGIIRLSKYDYSFSIIGLSYKANDKTATSFTDSQLDNGYNVKTIRDVILTIIKKTNPTAAAKYHEGYFPSSGTFEYYQDPYFFCVELVLLDDVLGKKSKEATTDHSKTLAKIKQILPREELISILKKHADQVVEINSGVAVINNRISDRGKSSHFRYFVRKRIRELGLKLPKTRIEKEAKEAGIE